MAVRSTRTPTPQGSYEFTGVNLPARARGVQAAGGVRRPDLRGPEGQGGSGGRERAKIRRRRRAVAGSVRLARRCPAGRLRAWSLADRRPRRAVHRRDDRLAGRRRRRGRRHPGPPPHARAPTGRRPCCTSTASPTTSSRPSRRVLGRAWLRLLRPRPAQVRPLAPRRTSRPTSSPTCATTSPSSTRRGSGSPSATATTTSWLSAHSTGGLTVPLWADPRQPAPGGPGAQLARGSTSGRFRCARPPAPRRSTRSASAAVRVVPAHRLRLLRTQPPPRPRRRVGLQPRAGSRSMSFPVYAGWLAPSGAATPSCTAASTWAAPAWCSPPAAAPARRRWARTCTGHDIVLDVEQIRRWAPALGRHVTLSASRAPARRHPLSRPRPLARLRRARALADGLRRLSG